MNTYPFLRLFVLMLRLCGAFVFAAALFLSLLINYLGDDWEFIKSLGIFGVLFVGFLIGLIWLAFADWLDSFLEQLNLLRKIRRDVGLVQHKLPDEINS